MNHPCQALADWKTMDDPERAAEWPVFVLSWGVSPARVAPRRSGCCRSHGGVSRHGSRCPAARRVCLAAEIMQRARAAAALSGGSVRETTDRNEALAGANIVYAKEWGSTSRLRQCRGAMPSCAVP